MYIFINEEQHVSHSIFKSGDCQFFFLFLSPISDDYMVLTAKVKPL